MHILLLSSTFEEVKSIFQNYHIQNRTKQYPFCHTVNYQNSFIDIFITGPGINSTAFFTASQLAKSKYDICVMAGICGAFNRNLVIGEPVQVKSQQFAQAGAEDGEGFLDIFQLGLMEKNNFPYSDGILINKNHDFPSLRNLKKVNSITVETVHGKESSIKNVVAKYNPDIESMEGAAFFFACLHYNIPFVEIRAVSNYVERRNKESWNIPLAIKNLNNLLIQLLNELAE